MKKYYLFFLMAFVLALSACGNGPDAASVETPAAPPSPAPTATPTPDFSGTDLTGRWRVLEVVDSNGFSVGEAQKQALGADFTLELLPGGVYFVYAADGRALGQGAYSVTLNSLTLTAQGSETVYEIIDAQTLRIAEPDGSITVMKREAEEADEIIDDGTDNTGSPDDAEDGGVPDGGDDIEDEDSGF